MNLGRVGKTLVRSVSRNVSCIVGLSAVVTMLVVSPLQAQDGPSQEQESQALALEKKRIVSILQDKLSQLEKREEAIRTREKELKVLRANVERKLKQMQEMRRDLQDRVEKQRRLQKAKVKELSGIYENMNPARAALAMLSMDRELAIGILSNMRRKLAGEVLDQMPGEEAAEISRDYSNMGGGEPPP